MSAPNPAEARIIGLIDGAERAYVDGDVAEADRLLGEAQAVAPDHPLVLNQAGVHALRLDRNDEARTLFESCLARAPRHIPAWINLSSALQSLGRHDDALRALDSALATDQRNVLALLQKGSLLETLGRTRAGATYYKQALNQLPAGSQLPPFLEPSVRRALDVVRANDAELGDFLAVRLADVRARHAGARHDRFDHCLDTFLGRRRIYESQPSFLHFPKVPSLEFHDRDRFAWLDALEGAADAMRGEMQVLLATSAPSSTYYLWSTGTPESAIQARCPATTAALGAADVPRAEMAGFGPTALFLVLEPGTRVPPQHGVSNARLIVHLPLLAGPGCTLRVGSDTRTYAPGKAWVFDDSIEHEIRNDGDSRLAVLIFDVWNPYLTATERELVRAATVAVHEYYRAPPPAGGQPA